MELPFKFEIPKLSHLHFLHLLVPFIPGTVVVVCLVYGNQSAAHQVWNIDLGYKTKVALAVAATGVLGLAVMSVTQVLNAVVMTLSRRPKPASPWSNSFWRRVAAAYLGSTLSPGNASFPSPEDLDRQSKFIAGLSSNEVEQLGIAKRRKTLHTLEKSLAQLAQSISDATARRQKPEVNVLLEDANRKAAEATSTLQAQKQILEGAEEQLRVMGIEFEWISFYHALLFLEFPNISRPYGGPSLVMASLQAAGIAALWFMIQFGCRSLNGFLFVSIVVIATTYALFLDFRLNAFSKNLDSAQLAGMIQEIRQQSGHIPSEH